MDFVFDILLPPYLARINLEKAESAYYLYQNWSKSRLPPKKPMWTDTKFLDMCGQNIRKYTSLFKSFSTKCRGFSKKDLITLDISFNHYRVVAEELANQEEHEVLGILHDVQGFLKRPEGLPNYISKTDLFLELVKIWKNPSVSPEKKAEAIDTSAHLLKVISGKKSRKKNSHSTIDVSNRQ